MKVYSIILRPVFAFMYIVGLSFIIPYLLATMLPEEIDIKYNSTSFLITSIILVVISITGTFIIKEEELSKTLKSLSYYSLIPGVLSVVVTVFGKEFLISFFTKYNEALQPIIIAYLDAKIPKLWFLTLAYIFLGIIFYYIGRKLR